MKKFNEFIKEQNAEEFQNQLDNSLDKLEVSKNDTKIESIIKNMDKLKEDIIKKKDAIQSNLDKLDKLQIDTLSDENKEYAKKKKDTLKQQIDLLRKEIDDLNLKVDNLKVEKDKLK